MSKLQVDDIVNKDDTGSVGFSRGVVVTGVMTATSFSGGAIGDFSIEDKIVHTGDTNTAIRFPAADTFTVETGGSERFRVTSAGLVGIGTDNPGDELDIQNNGASFINIKNNTDSGRLVLGSNTSANQIKSADSGNGARALQIFTGTTTTNGINIDTSGRVLVGNTQDSSPFSWGIGLQVAGTSTNAGLSIRRDQNSSGGALLMFVKSRGSLNGNTVVQDGDQIGGMYFNAADGTDVNSYAAQIACEIDGTPGSNDVPGRLKFSTTADGASSPTERMRIHSGGVVSFNNGIELGSGLDATAANTLDDYEEGTWTPHLYIGSTQETLDVEYGLYRKIGSLVFIKCHVSASSITGTGAVQIRNLPFTQASGGLNQTALSIQWSGTLNEDAVYANTWNNNNIIQFSYSNGSGNTGTLSESDIAANSNFGIAGCYDV